MDLSIDKKKNLFREFIDVALPYWISEERWTARGLLAVIIALTLGNVYIVVLFNRWDGEIFNAIQQFDKSASIKALYKWPGLVALVIGVTTYQAYLIQMLGVRWRKWMTAHLLEKYLSDDTYFFWQLSQNEMDNPDQRITEDIRDLIDKSIGLFVNILNEAVTLLSFVAILWSGSGSLSFTVFGLHISIPGYMFWACLLYTLIGTGLIHKLGHRLIGLDFNQQKYEANFRFSLVRLRENAESIALNDGAAAEGRKLKVHFQDIFSNFWEIMTKKKQLSFFTLPYNRTSGFFLMALTLPKFFAKEITFGTLMILQGAFFKVKSSLSFFVNSYAELALWRSILIRMSGFIKSIESAKTLQKLAIGNLGPAPGDDIIINGVSLTLPNQQLLIHSLNGKIKRGSSVLISGPSGCGKTTLFRAISGIWPFMEGSISIPNGQKFLVLPQKSYMPIGTLTEALVYPSLETAYNKDQITELLSLCELDHLKARLEESANWGLILSPGEQQRVAFIRAFLLKPDWLFLDESTSALDEKMQATLYGSLPKLLSGTTIISITHRTSLEEFHHVRFEMSSAGLLTLIPKPDVVSD